MVILETYDDEDKRKVFRFDMVINSMAQQQDTQLWVDSLSMEAIANEEFEDEVLQNKSKQIVNKLVSKEIAKEEIENNINIPLIFHGMVSQFLIPKISKKYEIVWRYDPNHNNTPATPPDDDDYPIWTMNQ